MRRRDVLPVLVAASIVWPFGLVAQETKPTKRLGVLKNTPENDPVGQASVATMENALRLLGWQQGRNLMVDHRWFSGDPEGARSGARELVRLKPDALFVVSERGVAALSAETDTIPIVFAVVSDPVGLGFVNSLSAPGGNITGDFSIIGKWIELLQEVDPRVSQIILLHHPSSTSAARQADGYLRAADELTPHSIQLIKEPAGSVAEIEEILAKVSGSPGFAAILVPDALWLGARRQVIIRAAARHKIPVMYPSTSYVGEGLMSYGTNLPEMYRRSATIVEKVLKGTRPAEIPVERPDIFELAINLETATALGLSVSEALLARADVVIE